MVKSWLNKPVKGLLLDISGVLYNSGGGGGQAIAGSVDAVKRLQAADFPVRFVSNETSRTRDGLRDKLAKLGFQLKVDQIFTPAPATAKYLLANQLRPHLLVDPCVRAEFDGVCQTEPNCVVLGDAAEHFTNDNMNAAFQLLMTLEERVFITMGHGKYYMETDGLKLDVGAYAAALEYACDVKPHVIGKPSDAFFSAAVADLGLEKNQVVMIGDDLVSDIGGAQQCGIRGVQVRTGKWRPEWEDHPTIAPDGIEDDLSSAVDCLLSASF